VLALAGANAATDGKAPGWHVTVLILLSLNKSASMQPTQATQLEHWLLSLVQPLAWESFSAKQTMLERSCASINCR
jgi:hypothetical protein